MGTGQSQHEIVERPQSIEHSTKCGRYSREIEWQVRDGVRLMVSIIEEAGGSLGAGELERRMEAGGSRRFDRIHHRASREGLVYRDSRYVFHVPEERPAPTPEERARHETYQEAVRLGVVRWSGDKRIVVPGDACPFTDEEIETIKGHIRAGKAIAESAEVSRMNRLHLEGKVTKAELDAYRGEVARRAREPQLQEQRRPQASRARKVRR